jgi:hypothetical protein
VSVNVIFTVNYHTDTKYLKKSIVTEGRRFSFYALKFIGISNRDNDDDEYDDDDDDDDNNNNNNKVLPILLRQMCTISVG